MSDDLLTRVADKLRADAQFGYGNPDMQLIRDLAARVRELEAERLTHGNVMGRIAIALFSDQNNRTDEECVAAVAELSYERSGAIQRAKRAEDERNTLRALLLERCPECKGTGLRDSGGTHPWGEPALLPCDHGIDAALGERHE